MFKIDFSQINDTEKKFEKITDGTYEVLVDSTQQNASKSGTDFLDIRLRIRSDFNQPFKNQLIFYKIWISKKDNQYPMGMISNLAKQAGLADRTAFNDIDAFLQALIGKALKVTVKNETNEYNGKTYERLNVKRIEESALASTSLEIDDSDLPF